MDYKLTITVISDKEHPPISINIQIPEGLALMLMKTPIKATSLGIAGAGGIILDKSKLLDFK
ncbi:MAG: hypothetical protein A2Y89_03130 [Chloroflexi bacterium RBG_13_51_18]|nr:MAG: hypothetical protein A2Y89_03130 [Chloroflexi bacterium RBG_13_51_18]